MDCREVVLVVVLALGACDEQPRAKPVAPDPPPTGIVPRRFLEPKPSDIAWVDSGAPPAPKPVPDLVPEDDTVAPVASVVPAPKRPASWVGSSLTLRRTRCFGACPMYSVTVNGDGTVDYTGVAFVATKGVQHGKATKQAVAALFDFAWSKGFWSLADRYTVPCTDQPSANVDFRVATVSKTVSHYGPHSDCGPGDAPSWLVELQDRIDAIAGTRAWVPCRDPKGKPIACARPPETSHS